MPFVLDGERGDVQIEAGGVRHIIEFRVDRIREEPVINWVQQPSDVRNGTVVTVPWPHSACSILSDARERFLQIAANYAWLNPHTAVTVDWFGERTISAPMDPTWPKWKPSDPTSPHWYSPGHLERLLAAYVSLDADLGRDRTVREVVAEFRGLSGSAKQKAVLEEAGLSRAPLSQLVRGDEIDHAAVARLLTAMKAHSKPVKSETLLPGPARR